MRRLVLTLAVLATGCMHSMSFIDSGIPFAPHPNVSPSQVRLYRPGDPMPRFTEIGYIELDQIFAPGAVDPHRAQTALAVEAAFHGCNAVVLHDGCSRVSHDRHGTHRFARIAATCVWVEDP